ncbi:MAG TPA: hypothetical protein VLY20_08545 [Nitrospiria bacterium]|nr:hypothetical protein [Nitrospiria bacterium]
MIPFNRIWIWSGLLACLMGGLVLGCATIDDLSKESYRKVGLPSKLFEQQALGILPLFGRHSVRDYLSTADAIFLESFQRRRGGQPWIDPHESLKRIREADLGSVYEDLVKGYSVEQPPRQEPLQRIGKAVGTRFLLLTELQKLEMDEGATEVKLTGRVWDAEKGEILWEGVGESRGYVVLIFPWVPSSFEKTMAIASDGLIERLPF